MRYLGGKSRFAKQISSYIKENSIYDSYFEPFVGGLNIIQYIDIKNRIANDLNFYLIEMYKAVQSGYDLPEEITREQYMYLKYNKDEDIILSGFIGIACSFGGDWFRGYASDKEGTNYAKMGKKSLLKKMEKLKDVKFESKDYRLFSPKNMTIYCDPPYAGAINSYIIKNFDTEDFWNTMRKWSKNNQVFISEFNAPDDFKCVLEFKMNASIQTNADKLYRVDKLFTIR